MPVYINREFLHNIAYQKLQFNFLTKGGIFTAVNLIIGTFLCSIIYEKGGYYE